jgi:hypothetical protein
MRYFGEMYPATQFQGAPSSATESRAASRNRCGAHCSFEYSALACCWIGMLGSASFQRMRKSL